VQEAQIITEFIDNRRVEGDFRCELLAYGEPDRQVIARLVSALNPSANALRAILAIAREIAARDEVSLAGVLSRADLAEVLSAPNFNFQEKQRRVAKALRRTRFPQLAEIEDELDRSQYEIRRNFGIAMKLPADLEGDTVEFSVRARSPEDLLRAAKQMEEAASSAALRGVFKILKGEG
jgi:hypothetical protein